ncbi:3-hydroxyacyl-CoA dehydrogenase family protein [Streptomyces sp. V3I7]|uniref:3-hydroxyacyl-CoA dehydrogenase family protein n=1 Tax=Streptomyces sp. V3I7 TaxID=3042278 RepID=UPI0027848882|nr:3-hydroxyacyl-CoA dehydrogenase family protein [Streptomyces sp. V3I7]MDQ0992765.1 3-hydroxybutyryl-CoA dehydrogenase [Streptomyces sp. V3I7]
MTSAAPARVGVIGAGRMGGGIAQTFAQAGSRVTLVDNGEQAARQGLARITDSLQRAADRGLLSEAAETVAARITPAASLSDLPADTVLVVEAVFEDATLKAGILADVEKTVGPQTLLATNTSSLSVTELAAALDRPERFLGMHFFNPVPASALVELVTAPATARDTLERTLDFVHALGKKDVVVKDSPGFASSRLGVALGLEAIRMVEEGVAEPEAIDDAMTLGYKHPMGPLRLTDLVGLDVRLSIAEYLHATLGERFAPPRLLRDKVARGELGRKSGKGFYTWQ